MKHYDRKPMVETGLKLANDYERQSWQAICCILSFLALQRLMYLSDMKLFLKAFLVDNFLNTFNFSSNWAVICGLLFAEVLSLPFITSEAVHSILKQVCHVKAEHECGIRLPQPCWLILKSFAVHKSSAADIIHLPFSCPTLQPCAEKRVCLGPNPTTSALIFLFCFSTALLQVALAGSVSRCVLLS